MLLRLWTRSWTAGSRAECHHCGHGNGSVQKCHLEIKNAAEDANDLQKHANGRRRIIAPQEDRYVSLMAKRNRNATPNQIAADLVVAFGTHVYDRAILFQLNQVCFYARKPVRYISLQSRHRWGRLYWCKEHTGWDHQLWSRRIFTGDSRFSVLECIMDNAKHCFTPLSEVMLHRRGTAEKLFWIILLFLRER